MQDRQKLFGRAVFDYLRSHNHALKCQTTRAVWDFGVCFVAGGCKGFYGLSPSAFTCAMGLNTAYHRRAVAFRKKKYVDDLGRKMSVNNEDIITREDVEGRVFVVANEIFASFYQ